MGKLMTDVLIVIFVILLTMFLIFKYESSLKEAYSKVIGKTTCEASVRGHAALKLRFGDFSGEINCPAIKLKIDDKNEEIVKKKIADAMVDCWDQFGKGKLELFKDDSVYCAICHRITFDKDIQVKGFTQYLAKNNPSGQSISYLKYMTPEKTQSSDFLNALANQKIDDIISASYKNEYAIIFTYIKGKEYLKEYSEKLSHISPGAGFIAVGVGLVFKSPAVAIAVTSIAAPFLGPAAGAVGAAAGGTVASVGTITFGVGALWSYLAATYAGVPFEHISLISFIPYDSQYIKSLNCKEIPIK